MKRFSLGGLLRGDDGSDGPGAGRRRPHRGAGAERARPGRGGSDRRGSERGGADRGTWWRTWWPGAGSGSGRGGRSDRGARRARLRSDHAGGAPEPPRGHGGKHAEPLHSRTGALPDPESAYAYGVADGRQEVEPDHFRGYLRHSLEERDLEARLAEAEDRERSLEDRLEGIREQRQASAARAVEADDLRDRIAERSDRLETVADELDAAEEERKEHRRRGLLAYTLMFGVAAVSFILADVVITRTIVADALGLTGRTFFGIDEAWYFASALALLAVLLKPAYDRLVESRWWEGDRRRFVATILVASAFAVGTLGVLGMFRAVAFEAQTLGELALQAPGADPAQQWAAMRDLQQDVVTSGWGKAAFIMSGILFAVAGAICLGISLRHFHDFMHVRWPLGRRRRKLRRERKRLTKRMKKDAAALTEARAELRRAEIRLGDLPDLDRARADVEAARDERRELLDRRTNVRRDRLHSLHADGYAMGTQLGDLDSVEAQRRERPRPHVALRRSIRAAFEEAESGGRDAGSAGARRPESADRRGPEALEDLDPDRLDQHRPESPGPRDAGPLGSGGADS